MKKKVLVPKLRFGEFEEVWKLNNSKIKIVAGNAYKLSQYSDRGHPLIQGFNIMPGYLDLKDEKKISFDDKQSHIYLYKGDVLMGLNRPITNGELKVCRYSIDEEGVLYQRAGKIEADWQKLNIDLIYHFLRSPKFLKHLSSELVGSDQPYLKSNLFEVVKFHIPSLPEQQKIASFLSAVDEKIQLLNRKKELLEDYKKGIMQKLFPKKAGQAPELRFKQADGSNFPDWEEKKFSKYIKLYRGSSPRPIVLFVTKEKDGVNWIKIGDTKNAKNDVISFVEEKITQKGAEKSRYVERGELILANSMSFGKTYLLDIEGCIYDGWFVLREYEEYFDRTFLHQVLNSEIMQKQYIRLSTGGVVQNISSEIVYSTKLFKPSKEEQKKIADFLSSIDEKINQITTQINQTQTFKKGLLQQMFV